jgi:hypothetical protein
MSTPDEDLPEALYLPDRDTNGNDRYVPTIATRGPWSPDAQHGGPVAALFAREVERIESLVPLSVVRLTLELFKPVPLRPLRIASRLRRPGRRVQLVELALLDGDTEVAAATVLRLRAESVPIDGAVPMPGRAPDDAGPPPAPTTSTPSFIDDRWPWLNTIGMDVRFVAGELWRPGPAVAWFRMRMPLVAGEEPSPAQRALIAADSGSGVGAALEFGRYRFLNPELTVHLARRAVGEWIAVDAGTVLSEEGTGVTTTRLWDAAAMVGSASAALLVEPG